MMSIARTVALLSLVMAAAAAGQDSPSHLLERGKYSEQTLGDLQAAIDLYRQIVADAEANRQHVAEARLRLGLCLKQLGRVEDANAELRKVMEQFADLTDIASQAREAAAESAPATLELQPAPWEDGEVLRLDMKMMSGFPVGSLFTSAEATADDGRPIWRLGVRRLVTLAKNEGISRVDVDRQTFAPLSSSFHHTLLGKFDAQYSEGQVVITVPESKDAPRTEKLVGTWYDNEQGFHLMRQLPMSVGYKATIPVMVTFGPQLPLGVEVTAREPVTVPAGTFDCFKLELNIGQTFWFSTDAHRYLSSSWPLAVSMIIGESKPWRRTAWHLPSVNGYEIRAGCSAAGYHLEQARVESRE